MNRPAIHFISILALQAASVSAHAETTTLFVPRVSKPPVLEQVLSGIAREPGARVNEFWQRQPNDGKPATLETSAYLSYDDVAFYVIFVCREDPSRIRARMSPRESISGDDIVGIALDTFHDGRQAYMFYANPLGVQLDGITTEGQPDDYKFDAVWSSEGRLTAGGYIVRFAIPFKSIRFPQGGDRSWGIALTRSIPRNNEYAAWPRITDRIEAYVPQFAAINAPEQVLAGRNVTITPYGFLATQTSLADSAPQVMRRQFEARGGLDSKIVLRDKLTLDVTVNPDFSQVESDEPQVTLNQRYEVYFPEKRPFFLENAAFFQTPETLFFSRRVVDPEFGAKLTGKIGPWTLGMLSMDDRAPVRAGVSDNEAVIGVARLQRDLGNESTAGIMFTSRRMGGRSNEVGSADFRWKLNPHWVLTGQAMSSRTQSANAASSGTALFGEVHYADRHLRNTTTFRDRSGGFDAELGFFPRTDIRQVENDTSYRWRPETGPVTSFGPSADVAVTYDHAGTLQDWSMRVPFWVNLKGPTSFYVARNESYELYRQHAFRRHSNAIYASTDRWKWFGITGYLSRGVGVNYYPPAGLAPFSAATVDGSLEITLRPTGRLRLDESYYYTRLGSVFTNHLARSKMNYQFSRAMSARLILDYDGSPPGPSRKLTTDILFTCMLHPGTALYAGYTDRSTFHTGRQFFVKLSYMFRL